MNLRQMPARITRGASAAAKSYLGRVNDNRDRHDERNCDQVSGNTRQTAAKLKEVFHR